MQDDYFIQELRRKIEKVLSDKASSYSHIDALTEYLGKRLTSDSAQYHAMKAREAGGTTLKIIEAAFFGAFGTQPKQDPGPRLDSEQSTPAGVLK